MAAAAAMESTQPPGGLEIATMSPADLRALLSELDAFRTAADGLGMDVEEPSDAEQDELSTGPVEGGATPARQHMCGRGKKATRKICEARSRFKDKQ